MSILEGMWVGNVAVADGADVMTQTESYSNEMESLSLPNLTPSELAAMGKKNIEAFAGAQAELFSMLQDAHRHWFDRMQSEAELASELANTLKNCRTFPDAVAAYQEWTSRRFEIMANDGKHVLADCQKAMQTGARFLANGLLVNGKAGATTAAKASRAELADSSETEAAVGH